MSMPPYLSQLQTLGLTEKEAKAYLVLVNSKKGTAQSVADAAGIKRPTCYQVLDSLISKKLVAVTKFRNVKDYRALPLGHLKAYIQAQRRAADVALPEMQKHYNARQFKVRLRVYSTLNDVKTLFEKSIREKTAMHILGSQKGLSEALGDYFEFYNKRAAQLKIVPKFKECHGTVIMLLWSDKVAFVSLSQKPQVFGFKNKDLHTLYQTIWNRF